jgi:hypothetical protein
MKLLHEYVGYRTFTNASFGVKFFSQILQYHM